MALKKDLIEIESEYDQFTREIRALRQRLIEVTAERDGLLYHICPDLQAEYDARIGILENQVYAELLNSRRLQREIEYVQATMNRQEKPDFDEAERKVNEEFKQYEDDLKKKAEDIKNSQKYREQTEDSKKKWENEQKEKRSDSTDITIKDEGKNKDSSSEKKPGDKNEKDEEYKSWEDELKKRYRKIVKRLHPDMNPNQTEEEMRMFREAVEAYQNGDLEKLREICAILDGMGTGEEFENTPEGIEQLRAVRDTLKATIAKMMEEIDDITHRFPYTAKEFLEDEEAVAERQKELQEELKKYSDICDELEERLKKMKAGTKK